MELGSHDAIIGAVEQDVGISILPVSLVRRDVERRAVCALPVRPARPTRRLRRVPRRTCGVPADPPTDRARQARGDEVCPHSAAREKWSAEYRDGPRFMDHGSARLSAPLLYVAASNDPTQRGRGYIFDRAPQNPLNRYVTVNSDHIGTPAAAQEIVLNWLATLNGP